jgi:hypothetical protein
MVLIVFLLTAVVGVILGCFPTLKAALLDHIVAPEHE